MALIPLKIAPGIYRNGTEYEQSGRWRDGSLIRWSEGSLRPVGGWTQFTGTAFAAKPRGIHGWAQNNGNVNIAAGTYNKLYYISTAGNVSDITPTSGFTVGEEEASQNTAYSGSTYGTGLYGVARNPSDNTTPATTWAIDNWGEYLVACSSDDGKILQWQLDPSVKAAPLTNAPTGNRSIVVTEERFIFALGSGGNPRKISWCDRESDTVWTAAATNEAGDIELQTEGKLMTGIRVRGRTLILTSSDAHVATYQGPPYVYGFERVGSACGTISPRSLVSADKFAFWMGPKGFFVYDGSVAIEKTCDVADYVFGDINTSQMSKVYGVHNSRFSEVWWFYPSASSIENNRYVVYDYKDNIWFFGQLGRTAGIDVGPKNFPIWSGTNGHLYLQEYGFAKDGAASFVESGPIELGAGERVMRVTSVVPDEGVQGDVNVTFKTKNYPNGAETTTSSFNTANPTDVRFTGRQVKMRLESQNNNDFRIGTFRLEARPGGKR
tara:strand:+ start:2021 stop:3502 length:1482 start_codon:yes stop_codon:yes gene_type:complete